MRAEIVPAVPPPRPSFNVGRETVLAIGEVKRGEELALTFVEDEPRKMRGEEVEPRGLPRPKRL